MEYISIKSMMCVQMYSPHVWPLEEHNVDNYGNIYYRLTLREIMMSEAHSEIASGIKVFLGSFISQEKSAHFYGVPKTRTTCQVITIFQA